MRFTLISIFIGFSINAFGFFYPYNEVHNSPHFEIHYNVDSIAPCKSKSYVSGFTYPKSATGDPDWMFDPADPKIKIRTVPYYIRDIARYLEISMSAYIRMGLYEDSVVVGSIGRLEAVTGNYNRQRKAAKSKIAVYVSSMSSGDGEYSPFTGSIYLHSNIAELDPTLYPAGFPTCNNTSLLAKACAHELLHAVTHGYYSAVASNYTRWWWEILAVQADKLVFPNTTPTEAEMFAMKNGVGLHRTICESWDKCNTEPLWYLNSSFLSYLLYHRPGQKADFKSILLAPVSGTINLSYTRTYLDEYVKSGLGSPGLGSEFSCFCKWMLDKEYPDLFLDNAMSNDFIKQKVKVPNIADPKQSIEQTVPYLSMQTILVMRNSTKNVTFSIKKMNDGNDLPVYLYENNISGRKFIRELNPYSKKDSIIITTKERAWTEIVLINASMGTDQTAKLLVTDYPDIEGNYQGDIMFSGKNPKLDAKYTKDLSHLNIDVKADGSARCDFEFHKFYPRDGFYARGTTLTGKVDMAGHLVIIGAVNAFSYPKGSQGCCDFPQVLTDDKCIKFRHQPYYWKFEGDIVNENGKKIILNGDIAAGTNPVKFMKMSEQLYKFTTERKGPSKW